MRKSHLILAALAGLVTFGANAQQPAAGAASAGPMIREGVTEKISEHVYVIPDNSVPGVPNVGIIVGNKATLVVDTGMGKRNGEAVMREVKKVSKNDTLYLVTTHVHPEHDLGAQGFPEHTKMIRAQAQVDEIASQGMQTANAFRSRSQINKDLLEGAEFRKASEVFAKEKLIDLGGVKVKLLAVGPNHTAGDTVINVEGEGVVFSGDTAMKPAPAFGSPASSIKAWLTTLDTLDALKPKIVVPSHGPNGDAKYIADYRSYMTTIRDRTAELKKQGKTVEQANETLTAELASKYPNAGGRLAGAVRAAYREAP
jgi:glyoxylase-like metal-dependent hydrolase (beta-lactamase superfamily II)